MKKHKPHKPNKTTIKAMEEARAKDNQPQQLTLDRRKQQRRSVTTILQQVEALIYGERNKVYKRPNENFHNIAHFWNDYLLAIEKRLKKLILQQ